MDGISLEQDNNGVWICHIQYLSDDFSELISKTLSSICNGAAKASKNSALYTYRRTLKEFIKRYELKPDNTKKGMIGELLTHLLLVVHLERFSSVNPYFNLEEESIKKGFDLILRDNVDGSVWMSEVKSGNAGQLNSEAKVYSLLDKAKLDIFEKLNSTRWTLWQNAINGAGISLESGNIKEEVIEILEKCNVDADEGIASSDQHNVILSAVLFNDLEDKVTLNSVSKKHERISSERKFRDLIVFTVQKTAYQSVIEFLALESTGVDA